MRRFAEAARLDRDAPRKPRGRRTIVATAWAGACSQRDGPSERLKSRAVAGAQAQFIRQERLGLLVQPVCGARRKGHGVTRVRGGDRLL